MAMIGKSADDQESMPLTLKMVRKVTLTDLSVLIKPLASISSCSLPQKFRSHEPVPKVKQSSADVSDSSRSGESLPYGQGKLQVPMRGHTPSIRLHGQIRSRAGLAESISSGSNVQWLKRGFKSVTRLSRTSLITALKAILLLKSVHAEEESILDTATVNSTCSSGDCRDEQLVISPLFKSRWYGTTDW